MRVIGIKQSDNKEIRVGDKVRFKDGLFGGVVTNIYRGEIFDRVIDLNITWSKRESLGISQRWNIEAFEKI